jgi:alkylation response protein AidB-like acyl-CoA dehydrogenase
MDFELTDEQKQIRNAAREFSEGEFNKDLALELDQSHQFPFEIWKKACKLGFIGVHFPEEFGGQNLGVFENMLVVEQFCRRDSGIGIALSLADYASEIILRFGTEDQRKAYLLPVTKGEAIPSGGFWEAEDGEGITNISTAAKKEGDSFLINGKKTFAINSKIADFFFILCKTDMRVEPPHLGEGIIIVEKDVGGLRITENKGKMGIKMISAADLCLKDVKVPCGNMIGEGNKGYDQIIRFFEESKIEIAAQALGIAQGGFERAMEYAKKREQFGRKIVEFKAIQHKLADMALKIERARLLAYKAAWSFDKGEFNNRLTVMAKLDASKTAVEVIREAIQIFGGYGYMKEQEVERFYRDAWMTELYFGSRETQKTMLASELLGRLAVS